MSEWVGSQAARGGGIRSCEGGVSRRLDCGLFHHSVREQFYKMSISCKLFDGGGGLLLLLCVAFLLPFTSAQVILQHPENYTVYENQRVQFVCHSDDEAGVFWRINGRNPLAFDLLDVLQTTLGPTGNHGELLLTFIAVSEYNESLIQCHGFDGNSSEIETFKIQGVLAEVSALEVNYGRRSVTVSWRAPFSLNVTGVEPDIWYSVIIYNVTDEINPTVINITDTQYTFTPTSCNVYNVSVIPLNGVGQGNISDELTIQVTELQKESITAIEDGSLDITLTILCGVETVNSISFNHNEVVYEADVTNEVVIINLPANTIFDSGVFEILLTDGEKMEYELPEALSTYDIQRPQIESVDDDEIIVTGELINGSTAIGCFLVIESTNNEISFIALKLSIEGGQNFSEVIQLPSSNYSVYIHDLEEKGLPNIHPAHQQPFFITLHGDYTADDDNDYSGTCASITHNNNSSVTIDCVTDSNSSCLVVYRAIDNSILNSMIHDSESSFLIDLNISNVSETTNYSIAVFSIYNDDDIDKRPCASEVITVIMDDSDEPGVMSLKSPSTTTFMTFLTITPKITPTTRPIPFNQGRILVVIITIALFTTLNIIIITIVISCYRSSLVKKMKKREVEADDFIPQLSSHFDASNPIGEEPHYATLAIKPTDTQPTDDTAVVTYKEIDHHATNKLATRKCARLGLAQPSQSIMERTEDSATTPYDVIIPRSTNITSDSASKEGKCKTKGLPTVEAVMDIFYDMTAQWKEIASLFEFDEDHIDEIDTNNEMNEACLHQCVEIWVTKFNPTWDNVNSVLSSLREHEVSQLPRSGNEVSGALMNKETQADSTNEVEEVKSMEEGLSAETENVAESQKEESVAQNEKHETQADDSNFSPTSGATQPSTTDSYCGESDGNIILITEEEEKETEEEEEKEEKVENVVADKEEGEIEMSAINMSEGENDDSPKATTEITEGVEELGTEDEKSGTEGAGVAESETGYLEPTTEAQNESDEANDAVDRGSKVTVSNEVDCTQPLPCFAVTTEKEYHQYSYEKNEYEVVCVVPVQCVDNNKGSVLVSTSPEVVDYSINDDDEEINGGGCNHETSTIPTPENEVEDNTISSVVSFSNVDNSCSLPLRIYPCIDTISDLHSSDTRVQINIQIRPATSPAKQVFPIKKEAVHFPAPQHTYQPGIYIFFTKDEDKDFKTIIKVICIWYVPHNYPTSKADDCFTERMLKHMLKYMEKSPRAKNSNPNQPGHREMIVKWFYIGVRVGYYAFGTVMRFGNSPLSSG